MKFYRIALTIEYGGKDTHADVHFVAISSNTKLLQASITSYTENININIFVVLGRVQYFLTVDYFRFFFPIPQPAGSPVS
jgi:hypothetical protein